MKPYSEALVHYLTVVGKPARTINGKYVSPACSIYATTENNTTRMVEDIHLSDGRTGPLQGGLQYCAQPG